MSFQDDVLIDVSVLGIVRVLVFEDWLSTECVHECGSASTTCAYNHEGKGDLSCEHVSHN